MSDGGREDENELGFAVGSMKYLQILPERLIKL